LFIVTLLEAAAITQSLNLWTSSQ